MEQTALIERLWRLAFGADEPVLPNPIDHLWVVAMGASNPPPNALSILAQLQGLEYSEPAPEPTPHRSRRKATPADPQPTP